MSFFEINIFSQILFIKNRENQKMKIKINIKKNICLKNRKKKDKNI